MSSHSLLQGIFQAQGLTPGFLLFRQILYCLSHQGSPVPISNISGTQCFDAIVSLVHQTLFEAISILKRV